MGNSMNSESGPFLVVLGIAQDGGYPQAGCRKKCCVEAWENPQLRRHIACLGIVDPRNSEPKRWMIDATPDLREQYHYLDLIAPHFSPLDGIFITHGHIGHYTGLLQFGREAMGARGVRVHVMPRMKALIEKNAPWEQLTKLDNIELVDMSDATVNLAPGLSLIPLQVPHRSEYTETAGFRIEGARRKVLYIPDIDNWESWNTPIEDAIAAVDVAYLDGTFFSLDELPNRNIADVPHPFIVQSLKRFSGLPAQERAKIRFTHLNHTNPALQRDSAERKRIIDEGYCVAEQFERVWL